MYLRGFLAILLFCVTSVFASFDLDTRTLYALDLQERGKYEMAGDEFMSIYRHSKLKIHLKMALKAYSNTNSEKFKQNLIMAEKILKNDDDYNRMLAVYYIKLDDFKRAEGILSKIVQKSNQVHDKLTLARLYVVTAQDKAVELLEQIYKDDKNPHNLDLLIQAMIATKRDKGKIMSRVEEFYKDYGCEIESVCMFFAGELLKDNNIKKAMKIYRQVLNQDSPENIYSAIDLLVKGGFLSEALEILDYLYDADNLEARAQIYILSGRIYEVSQIFGELYRKTKMPKYLASQAIYEFEAHQSSINNDILKSVCDKFQKSINQGVDDAMVLNYYGYLLIDYDIDIQKGLKFVEDALIKDPKNTYYLDSLAWGFYKINQCQKAKDIMQKAFDIDPNFKQNEEAIGHIKHINTCVEKGK